MDFKTFFVNERHCSKNRDCDSFWESAAALVEGDPLVRETKNSTLGKHLDHCHNCRTDLLVLKMIIENYRRLAVA